MVSFGDRSIVRQKRAYESLFDWENRGRILIGFPPYDAVWVWGGIARTPDKDPDETGNCRVSRTTACLLWAIARACRVRTASRCQRRRKWARQQAVFLARSLAEHLTRSKPLAEFHFPRDGQPLYRLATMLPTARSAPMAFSAACLKGRLPSSLMQRSTGCTRWTSTARSGWCHVAGRRI
jgi:hypothetical protein